MLQLNFDLSSLNDGPITITLILVDAQGHQSAPIVTTSIKDSVPPTLPTITAPATVGLADLATFTITVSGETGSLRELERHRRPDHPRRERPARRDRPRHDRRRRLAARRRDADDLGLAHRPGGQHLGRRDRDDDEEHRDDRDGRGHGRRLRCRPAPSRARIRSSSSSRAPGRLNTAVTINLGWGGSATLTTDYTLTASGGTLGANGSTLTLAAGVTSATITAKPVDDSLIEPDETVVLTLTGCTAVSARSARRRAPAARSPTTTRR